MSLVCCYLYYLFSCFFFFFKQKTAYEMRISDWSSDVCSSDLPFPTAIGAIVKPVGLIQTAIGVEAGELPYFHTIHNHRIARFQPVGLVVAPADVVAERAAHQHFATLGVQTAHETVESAVEPRVILRGIQLVRPPERFDTDGEIGRAN